MQCRRRLRGLIAHLSGGAISTGGERQLARGAVGCPATAAGRVHSSASSAGPLSAAQVEQFHTDGFLVVDGILSVDDLRPIQRALERKLDRIADALLQSGVIENPHSELPLETRMEALAQEVPGLPGALHGDRSAVTAMRDLCELWRAPVLLDMVEQLLATPEIGAHSVINLRIRTATPPTADDGNTLLDPAAVDLHRVPAHQDAAYLLPEADNTLQVGIWLPVVADVPADGGALSFLRGGHRFGRCLPHLSAQDGTGFLSLTDDALGELEAAGCVPVDCPVALGSFVLFNNLVPHIGLPNHGSSTRWSVDMRWQAMDRPHGDDHNSGLVQLRSADPDFKMQWVAGPKATRPPEVSEFLGRWGEVTQEHAVRAEGEGGAAAARREAQLELHAASRERVGASTSKVKEATKDLLPWASACPARFWHEHEL